MTHLDTKVLHSGEPSPRHQGAVAMPIYQSATFENAEGAGYHDIRYARLSNTPNHLVLHAKLAALENAEAALVAASGMAAISTSLLTVLSTGDHLLAHRVLYGGTHDLLTRDFRTFGIEFDFIDGSKPDEWEAKLRPNTKAIYVETMTNPLLEVADHDAVVAFAREHRLVSLIDNTFASPINFRPPEHGYDLSLHSATKYLNGHSDLIAGAVIGRAELIDAVRKRLNHLGGSLDPHACFLLHRGIKTLSVRVKQQNASALAVAKFLERHPAVSKVNHPGLESHPHHDRAKRLFDGFGGMLSFEANGGAAAAQSFLSSVRIAIPAPSLGGVETLISRPAAMSHVGLSAEEREEIGIAEGLIRVSIGIEATEDLIADFEQALK
ncbi:MAG TPA: aminotransferase class I/II-fold pyridoxal phosphate-dependent enzyme [Thermoanaerobaculia bacterium]